jgi:hypothetical protein
VPFSNSGTPPQSLVWPPAAAADSSSWRPPAARRWLFFHTKHDITVALIKLIVLLWFAFCAEARSRSRWYGAQRSQLPAAVGGCQSHLSGAVAGDYGFDPLKLSEQPQQFDKYFEAELLHARCVVCGQASATLITHSSISTKTFAAKFQPSSTSISKCMPCMWHAWSMWCPCARYL